MIVTFQAEIKKNDKIWLMNISNRPNTWLEEKDWHTAAAASVKGKKIEKIIAKFNEKRDTPVGWGAEECVYEC